jgi:acetoin utilization deacetylase AcuC-like enzyme
MKLFYSGDYVAAGHTFETTRKASWVADSLTSTPNPNIEVVAPTPLTDADLSRVHSPEYVAAVRTGSPRGLAESQGFSWDAGLFNAVCASNGGAVAAALTALREGRSGSLSSGLHHARRNNGDGFCTFNGLALAADAAIRAGVSRLLVLDLDAHCGGGTFELLRDRREVWSTDVSVSGFDNYKPAERFTLDLVKNASDYLPTIERRLNEHDAANRKFELCLYNAGMDPFEMCSEGGLSGITREILARREALVFDWCAQRKIPIAFVLAGGYLSLRLDPDGLVALHRLTLDTAAR